MKRAGLFLAAASTGCLAQSSTFIPFDSSNPPQGPVVVSANSPNTPPSPNPGAVQPILVSAPPSAAGTPTAISAPVVPPQQQQAPSGPPPGGPLDLSVLEFPPQQHCKKPLPTLQQCAWGAQPLFTQNSRIAVVGGGPAGIITTHLLTKLGYKNVKVFEKDGRIGGLSKTNFVNGVAHEMGTCYTAGRYPCIVELIQQHFATMVPVPGLGFVVDSANSMANGPVERWQVLQWAQLTGKNPDPVAYQAALIDAMVRYRVLYNQIFGNDDFLFPDKPSPQQLAMLNNGSFKDFLIQNKLEALIPVLAFSQSANGYGFLEEVPLYYGLIWSTPSVFKSLILGRSNPNTTVSMLREGFETLWQRVSEPFKSQILLNAQISSIRRNPRQVQITYKHPSNPRTMRETFDFVILASRFPQTLNIIDARSDEKDVFGRLKSSKMYTRMISAKGLPVGQTGYITNFVDYLRSSPQSRAGVYYLRNELGILFPNLTEPNPIYVTGQQVGFNFRDQVTESQVDSTLVAELSALGGSNITILDRLSPDYFARFTAQEIQQGYPWKIWDMQGKYRTWYVGSFASFESVADIMDYSFKLIERNLCVPAPTPAPVPRPWKGYQEN